MDSCGILNNINAVVINARIFIYTFSRVLPDVLKEVQMEVFIYLLSEAEQSLGKKQNI
jgi:hypothetical protein